VRFDWWHKRKADDNDESALQSVGIGPILLAHSRALVEARRSACACSVVVNDEGKGTGFLIAKDLVITNYHVVLDLSGNPHPPASIRCRFGYFESGEYSDGRAGWVDLKDGDFPASSGTALGDKYLDRVDVGDFSDPKTGQSLYDYVILRLARPVGSGPGKGPLGGMNPLGWIAVDPNRTLPQVGQPLSVVEFPQRDGAGPRSYRQEPASVADGFLKALVADGLRVEHDASTKPGASGGSVFDSSFNLVGLHNAGRTRADLTAENRFIPIARIMADIKGKNDGLYNEIISAKPPQLNSSGMSRKIGLAIEERVEAAKIFLDREREHASIVAVLGGEVENSVRVNQILCDHNPDKVGSFIRRLTVSAARMENLKVAEVTSDFLRGRLAGSGSFKPWEESSITWPDPNTPPDQARRDMQNQLRAQIAGSRTLLVITVTDLDDRTATEELEYAKILGEILWSFRPDGYAAGSTRPLLLAIVVHQRPSDSAFELDAFAPLWDMDSPPMHCGASVALNKVGLNDVQPWVTLLNSAWALSDKQRIVVPDSFDRRARLDMSRVFEILEDTISNAATVLVQQSPEGD
jgi:hypothetical protein